MKNKILYIVLLMIGGLLFTTVNLPAQTPSPTPAMIGDYHVTSSIELGVRGLGFDGSDEKFRSDLNYRPGFRIFDSSFRLETKDGKGKPFDSLMITSSGWSADPSGFVRVNAEKIGAYSFKANIRKVNLINRISNLILGFHPSDTKRYFGDFDLTVFPQSEKLRLRFGGSFYNARGDRGFTTRTRDVFPIVEKLRSNTTDLRAGLDTKVAGFNLTFTAGLRRFDDRGRFVIESPQLGYAGTCFFGVCPTESVPNSIDRLERFNPTDGDTKYGMFTMQRTFAKKLDLTGRFIYSVTDREFNIFDNFSGEGQISRTNPTPIFIDADILQIDGRAKRPQSRGDVGLTYAATDSFRISNTFTFDQYNSFGDSSLTEKVVSRVKSTGLPRPDSISNSFYTEHYGFKRFTNTIEGDYQFNNRVGINLGYRFTHRKVVINDDEEENSAHIFLFGTKIKPTKSWSIYADGEHGQADNAFIRLANYDYTNFRVRSNWHYNKFTFNVSGIIRNNENPSLTIEPQSGVPLGTSFVANVRNRVFSAYVDYVPDPRWTLSSGYTYNYLTSKTDIVVPSVGKGFSEFYMKDNYFFVDFSGRPVNRVSFYGSYRYNKDNGQGGLVSPTLANIISSYPFQMHMPEFRMAIKLTKNIDWNIGYQYNDYKEKLQIGYYLYNELTTNDIPPNAIYAPNQNYRAHMPYTSLRIYFGGRDQ